MYNFNCQLYLSKVEKAKIEGDWMSQNFMKQNSIVYIQIFSMREKQIIFILLSFFIFDT